MSEQVQELRRRVGNGQLMSDSNMEELDRLRKGAVELRRDLNDKNYQHQQTLNELTSR